MQTGATVKLKIEDVLEREGKYVGPTTGVSMLPMLKTGRDSIVVLKKTARLSPYDVALYRRGEAYVLHRVLKLTETGYIIRGDNCYADEIVPEEAVIGVLTEYFRGDKHILCTDKRYLKYAKRRVRNYPVRRFFKRIVWKLKGIAKRILGRK
ncbi:MAG: S24/S26 family peptidase [Clostridia bacterium]|nr:S24/S26 family peptidase [Clostridia bacterium]